MEERPVGAHLVGSIPLSSADEVFQAAAWALGDHLRRMPDGETGPRADWIMWQYPVFSALPQFGVGSPAQSSYRTMPQLHLLRDQPGEVSFDKLGYALAARSSYRRFAARKDEGLIPAGCRFLVSLPTPIAPVSAFVAMEDQATVEPLYEAGMLAEVRAIADAIPHDQLAIQWDARYEFAMLEQAVAAWFPDVAEGIAERLLRLGAAVPADVELGYHLCYGDDEHGHFVEPTDAGRLVDVANVLATGLDRRLDFVHLPVPADRADDDYFAPLDRLRLQESTELFLGLLRPGDSAETARRRIAAAAGHVSGFGVATECGWGRGGASAVRGLLELHRDVSAPVVERSTA